MFHNGDTVNIEWTGGRVDSNVVVHYRYALYTNDKDLHVEKDNVNFRQYAWYVISSVLLSGTNDK